MDEELCPCGNTTPIEEFTWNFILDTERLEDFTRAIAKNLAEKLHDGRGGILAPVEESPPIPKPTSEDQDPDEYWTTVEKWAEDHGDQDQTPEDRIRAQISGCFMSWLTTVGQCPQCGRWYRQPPLVTGGNPLTNEST